MNEIKLLLEKYFLAETTLEEEKVIAEYFRSGEVDAELEWYAAFFEYIGEEKAVSPGVGFEERILERVGLAATAQGEGMVAAGAGEHGQTGWGLLVLAPVRRLRFGYAAAAAVVLCVCSLFLVVRLSRGRVDEAPPVVSGVNLQAAVAIKDTYDDPEKALAAVRKALLVASVHLNSGMKAARGN